MGNISKALGIRIRELRKARGLSQEELAFKANIATSFLGMIERSKKTPTIDTVEKIATALDISFEELFSFSQNTADNQEFSVIEKINFELKNRSFDEQETIYKLVKQILLFKDK